MQLIPPYKGPSPRRIRFRFPEPVVERLLKSKWWSLPESEISLMPYDDVPACLDVLENLSL